MATTGERPSVSEDVFRRLCEEILSGRYAAGEKIPTQRRLAADLGVNLASIREAVKRLEQLRLVDVRQGDAMRVTEWQSEAGLDVIAHVLLNGGTLDRGILADVFEARQWMLSKAAALAAERRTDDHAGALEDLAERLAGAGDAETAQSLDFAYFSVLVEASGNLVLVLVVNSIRRLYFDQAELFRGMMGDLGALGPLYRRAARAVREWDPEGAALAVQEVAEVQAAGLIGGF
jgi:DNA-binding FadR family transcriptional regulator